LSINMLPKNKKRGKVNYCFSIDIILLNDYRPINIKESIVYPEHMK